MHTVTIEHSPRRRDVEMMAGTTALLAHYNVHYRIHCALRATRISVGALCYLRCSVVTNTSITMRATALGMLWCSSGLRSTTTYNYASTLQLTARVRA